MFLEGQRFASPIFYIESGEKMIYTITFNPAVDLVIQVPNCQLGILNRSMCEEYVAGGKGIKVL